MHRAHNRGHDVIAVMRNRARFDRVIAGRHVTIAGADLGSTDDLTKASVDAGAVAFCMER